MQKRTNTHLETSWPSLSQLWVRDGGGSALSRHVLWVRGGPGASCWGDRRSWPWAEGLQQGRECQVPASRGPHGSSALLRDGSVLGCERRSGYSLQTCTRGLPSSHTSVSSHPHSTPHFFLAGGASGGPREPAGDLGSFSQHVSTAGPWGQMESLTARRARDKWSLV